MICGLFRCARVCALPRMMWPSRIACIAFWFRVLDCAWGILRVLLPKCVQYKLRAL